MTADDSRPDDLRPAAIGPGGGAAGGTAGEPRSGRRSSPRLTRLRASAGRGWGVVSRGLALLVGGGLLGYAVAAFGAGIIDSGAVSGRAPEAPTARAYLEAVADHDGKRAAQLLGGVDPATRALLISVVEQDQVPTAAVGYVGGVTVGSGGVYIYVKAASGSGGSPGLFQTYALSVSNGRIVGVR